MRTHVLIISAVVAAGIAAAGLVYWFQRSAPVLTQAEAAGKAPEPTAAPRAAVQTAEAPAAPAPQAAAPGPSPAATPEPPPAAEESHLVIGLRPINRLPPPPPAAPRPPAASPPPSPRATAAHRTHQKPPSPPTAPVEPNGASSGIRF